MCPIKTWNVFFLSYTSARLISNVRQILRVRLVFGVVLNTTLISVMDGVCVTNQNAHLLKVISNQFLPLSRHYYPSVQICHRFIFNNDFLTVSQPTSEDPHRGVECSANQPCVAGEFCNFDNFDLSRSGFCESCPQAGSVVRCLNFGLNHSAGVQNCKEKCTG